jgi:hypothetical protein
MNNEQQELLDEAYKNYSKEYEKDNSIGMCLLVKRLDGKSTYRKPNKEMFVDLCTYDKTFSEKWGLKIEERELSRDERFRIAYKDLELKKELAAESLMLHYPDGHNKVMDDKNIPTRLITVTYNDKTIESYENNS